MTYPQPPQGQYPQGQQYPAPQGPQFGSPQQPAKGSGFAIAALVLGIVSLALCWVPVVGIAFGIAGAVGLVLGILGFIGARKGARSGGGMALAGAILSLLAIIGTIATSVLYSQVVDEVNTAIADASASASAPADSPAPAPVEGSVATDAAPADGEPQVVALGNPAQIGSYAVQVNTVMTNARAYVAQGDPGNPPADGEYVVVEITALYGGQGQGNPFMDLAVTYTGNDGMDYSDATCSAILPNDAFTTPPMASGEQATFEFCMDVPADAVDDGYLYVRSVDVDDRVYWRI